MEAALPALSGGFSSIFSGMSSGTGTMLQGGATALSALSSITAGRVARREGDQAARMGMFAADFARGEGALAYRQGELDAKQEEIVGRQRSTQLTEELVQTLGGQRVAFAASGGDPTSGTAARLAEQMAARTAEDIEIEKSNTEIARTQALIRGSTARRQADMDAATLEADAAAARSKGRTSQTLGYLSAGEKVFNYGVSVAKRK